MRLLRIGIMTKGGRRAFWDSSALVPLFCRDIYTSRSRELLRRFPEIVTWWNTPVEIHGVLIRLSKEKRITPEGLEKGLGYVQQFRLRWREIQPVDSVRDSAEDCLDRFRIRSADAVQLAAALLWCSQMPRNRPFICYDSELSDAARQCGFEVYCVP